MSEHNCEACSFRAKFDENPKSFLGRVWRWHIQWCPGWQKYFESLSDEKKADLCEKYNLEKS